MCAHSVLAPPAVHRHVDSLMPVISLHWCVCMHSKILQPQKCKLTLFPVTALYHGAHLQLVSLACPHSDSQHQPPMLCAHGKTQQPQQCTPIVRTFITASVPVVVWPWPSLLAWPLPLCVYLQKAPGTIYVPTAASCSCMCAHHNL